MDSHFNFKKRLSSHSCGMLHAIVAFYLLLLFINDSNALFSQKSANLFIHNVGTTFQNLNSGQTGTSHASTKRMALTEKQKIDVVNVISRFEKWSDIYTEPAPDSNSSFKSMLSKDAFKNKVKTLKVKQIPNGPDGTPILDILPKDLAKMSLNDEAMDEVFSTFVKGSAKLAEESNVTAQLQKWRKDGSFNESVYERQVLLSNLFLFAGRFGAVFYILFFISPVLQYFFGIDVFMR